MPTPVTGVSREGTVTIISWAVDHNLKMKLLYVSFAIACLDVLESDGSVIEAKSLTITLD